MKVVDMPEAKVGKMIDVIGETKVLFERYSYIANRRICSEYVGGQY